MSRRTALPRRRGPTPDRFRPSHGLALTALVALLVGCGPDPAARPNVLLITADTLRADHLGAYGGPRSRTPALDRLASEGVAFDNAAAPMPVTKPSHFSVFTGHRPRRHGVVNNRLALRSEARTLAEAYSAAGYRTAGFPAVQFFDRASGAARGFGYYALPERTPYERADAMVERALAWLRSLPEGERFFAWLHLFDPHLPYAPPARYGPSSSKPVAGLTDKASWASLSRSAASTGGDLAPQSLRRARDLYAGEVRLVDRAVGRLLADLRRRGLLDSTVVAFTADHGECFEHGFYFRHADCLYDGAIRVPLILRYPPRLGAGRRIDRAVELRDLGRTLLALSGVEAPDGFGGAPLTAARRARAGGAEGYAVFQPILSDEATAEHRSRKWLRMPKVAGDRMAPVLRSPDPIGLRGERFKYILFEPGHEVLYDLRSEAGEGVDVSARHPELVAELRRRARRIQVEQPVQVLDPDAVSGDLRKTLESLGYL